MQIIVLAEQRQRHMCVALLIRSVLVVALTIDCEDCGRSHEEVDHYWSQKMNKTTSIFRRTFCRVTAIIPSALRSTAASVRDIGDPSALTIGGWRIRGSTCVLLKKNYVSWFTSPPDSKLAANNLAKSQPKLIQVWLPAKFCFAIPRASVLPLRLHL